MSSIVTLILWPFFGLQWSLFRTTPCTLISNGRLGPAKLLSPPWAATKSRHHTQPISARDFNSVVETEYEYDLGQFRYSRPSVVDAQGSARCTAKGPAQQPSQTIGDLGGRLHPSTLFSKKKGNCESPDSIGARTCSSCWMPSLNLGKQSGLDRLQPIEDVGWVWVRIDKDEGQGLSLGYERLIKSLTVLQAVVPKSCWSCVISWACHATFTRSDGTRKDVAYVVDLGKGCVIDCAQIVY